MLRKVCVVMCCGAKGILFPTTFKYTFMGLVLLLWKTCPFCQCKGTHTLLVIMVSEVCEGKSEEHTCWTGGRLSL